MFLSSSAFKLSARFNNELDINLKPSINFILYVIDLQLASSFLIGTEKVIYFSVFSPKHLNCPSNHYEILQEILLVFYILDYKYYEQHLCIFQYNDNGVLLRDIFYYYCQ